MIHDEMTEDQEDAAALLAVARHMMTGREIDICERLVDGELDFTKQDAEDDDEDAEEILVAEGALLTLLRLQFYAQIANWKDKGGACS